MPARILVLLLRSLVGVLALALGVNLLLRSLRNRILQFELTLDVPRTFQVGEGILPVVADARPAVLEQLHDAGEEFHDVLEDVGLRHTPIERRVNAELDEQSHDGFLDLRVEIRVLRCGPHGLVSELTLPVQVEFEGPPRLLNAEGLALVLLLVGALRGVGQIPLVIIAVVNNFVLVVNLGYSLNLMDKHHKEQTCGRSRAKGKAHPNS